jgi:hypothetical protein
MSTRLLHELGIGIPIISKARIERARRANARYLFDTGDGPASVDPQEVTDDDLRAFADRISSIENPESRRDAMFAVLTTHRQVFISHNKLAREFVKCADALAAAYPGLGIAQPEAMAEDNEPQVKSSFRLS